MKTILFLAIMCAAGWLSGCSTNTGGTVDTYNSSTGAWLHKDSITPNPVSPPSPVSP